jgi:electron transport complex protein RnfG
VSDNTPAMPPPTPVWNLYRAMVGVGIGCALLIVTVYQLTKPIIEKNQAEALANAIFKVLPAAKSQRPFIAVDGKLAPANGDESEQVYAAFDADGTLVGVAVPASGMGYQDTIKVLYGYDPVKEQIIGFYVLASLETPGLGDRIEKDPFFLKNFEALDLSVDESGNPKNEIVAVKQGEKKNPWEVDGISGATVSSVAVANLLHKSSETWPALIRSNLDILTLVKEASDGDE